MESNPTIIIAIGQRLYEERKRLKLTQREMAEAIGVTPQWYGKVERGGCRPSIEMLYELNSKYNLDITRLITGKKTKATALDRIVADCPESKKPYIEQILHSITHLYEHDED